MCSSARSEHEGFCVPLVESFHMGVPVLAYAATAVPSTMDGAGVLYTDKDPMHVAALDQRRRRRPRARGSHRRRPVRRARSARRARTSAARCCGFIDQVLARPAAASAGRVRFLGSGGAGRRARGDQGCTGRRRFWRLPNDRAGARSREAMIVNQWVPAAHQGRRHRRLGPARARTAARSRARIRYLRDDDRRRPARRRACRGRMPAATRGDLTIFHFALVSPMTAGVRAAAVRPRAAVSQRHAGAFLRRLRRRRSSGWRCSDATT